MPFVSERWLGGCLTNYRTIRDRLKRLQELEAMWLSANENPAKVDLPGYMRSMLNESGKLELSKSPETAPIRGYSKKMVATLNRELTKIHRNLSGIRDMTRLPDAIVVVDPKREHIAVKEACRSRATTTASAPSSWSWASWPTPCWKARRRCRPSRRRRPGRGRGRTSQPAASRRPRPPAWNDVNR
jgi:ribosomal protein S2